MNKGHIWPTVMPNKAHLMSSKSERSKSIEIQPTVESIDKGLAWSAVMANTMRVNYNNPETWQLIGLQPIRNKPLFDASQMQYFVNEKSKSILQMPGLPHRVALCVPLRYRNINDYLKTLDPKITPQVVILGSGFDTKPIKYKGNGLTFFEIDAAEVLNIKAAIYAANNLDKNASYIPLNYIEENLIAALEQHGLKFDEGTHFIWEGNSMYILDKNAIQFWQNILEKFTGRVSIAMDFCSKETVTQTTGLEQNTFAVEIFNKMGALLVAGYNDINQEFAGPLGLSVIENSSGAQLAQRYGVSTVEIPELEHTHVAHLVRE